MNEEVKQTLLDLLKLDLGITHTLRDAYFHAVIQSSMAEMERMSVALDLEKVDDQMLVVDFASWTYRNRQENVSLSRNLQIRIHNRIIQKAGAQDAIT